MIKRGKKEDLVGISDLTYGHYGNIEIANPEFLEHEYFKNPSGDAIVGIIENDTDEIIAQKAVWKMKYLFFNEEIICGHSLNVIVKKEYGGKGIFTKLGQKVFCWSSLEIGFCYATPNQNSSYAFKNKLGFTELGKIPLYVKPIIPSQLVRQKINSKILANMAKPINLLFEPKITERLNEMEIENLTLENVHLVDELWGKIKGKYNVMNIKNSQYIKFRYLEMPIREYKVTVVKEFGKVRALIVGRIMEVSGISCGMLVDFLCDENCQRAGLYGLKYMERFFFENKVSLMGCLMLEHTEESQILKKNKMFKCPKSLEPQPFPLMVKNFKKQVNSEELCNIKNWFFTMGDYDAI